MQLRLPCVVVGRVQRKVLHRFVMMAKRTMPTSIGDQADASSAEDKAAQEGNYSCFSLLQVSGIFHGIPKV